MDRKVFILFLAGILLISIGFVFNIGFDTGASENSLGSRNFQSMSEEPKGRSEVLSESALDTERQEIVVAKVLDGDTVETISGEKIRYIGINSPEKDEPFFGEALRLNESLVFDKNVELEFDIEKMDRYGRTLAYVFVEGKLVNLELVKKGLAVVQTIQPNVKYQDQIVNAQKEARENCLGIWSGLCKDEVGMLESSSGCVEITFINYDASGNDNENKNGEWIEISNSCSVLSSLDGWILKDSSASNRYQFKDFALERNKSVVVYSGCGEDSADMLYWKCPEGKYAIWNNAGDHAFLYNEKGELISDYLY